MLQWIADNQQLLIAIFGTGGAGAVLLTALLRLRRSGATAPQDVTSATASGGGIAASNSGAGNVVVTQNETVGKAQLQSLNDRLQLSLTESARLFKAMEAAQVPASSLAPIVEALSHHQTAADDLIASLKSNNIPNAAKILRGLHQPSDPA